MRFLRGAATLLAVCVGAAGTAQAQAPDPLARAMRAYQDLEYDSAAAFLRGALAQSPPLADADRARALMHLGATELFRERRDSAMASFRRLVLFDPRFRPDELRFPPEVSALFQQVRLGSRAVLAIVPPRTRIATSADRMQVRLYASGVHEITAVISRPQATGRPIRTLHAGAIGDSLELLWDGRDSAGARADSGSWVLRVISRSAEGRPVRQVEIPLEITRAPADTLPSPAPNDSARRPEFAPGGSGTRPLLTALLAAGATVLLPPLVAGESSGMPARFAVAGALGAAGIAGLIRGRRGRPLPENMAHNRQLTAVHEQEVARIQAENATMRRERALVITTGPARASDIR